MAHIKFMTDSAADIPAGVREELNIQVLPFPIAMEDRELRDGFDFTPEEFYDMLLAAPQIPTHAQLNPYLFSQCYEQALKEGCTDLIYTCINSKGSATFQNAVQARDEFYEDHPGAMRIHLIDSRTYTMCYGYPVMEAAGMAAAGASVEEIVAYLQDWTGRARVLFTPLDLRFAKKSGRVSAAAAFVGDALGLKPIMTFQDGESKILAKVRGEKNVIPTMLDLCQKDRRAGTPYLLVRGNNAAQSDKLHQQAAETLGQEPVLDYPIGGVIAINAGPNLIGIVYWT